MTRWTVALLAVALVALLATERCDGSSLDPATRATIDSLHSSAPSFAAHADTARAVAALDTTAARRSDSLSSVALARARRAALRADSLARTEAQWHAAYDARTEEADDLTVAVASKDSAWRSERSARIQYQSLYAADTLRRVAIERLNDGLVRTVEHPCRIAGLIDCPSRRASVVGGALLGLVAARGIVR